MEILSLIHGLALGILLVGGSSLSACQSTDVDATRSYYVETRDGTRLRRGRDPAHELGLSLVKTRAALKSRTYALLAPLEFRGEEGQTPPPCSALSSFLVTLGARALQAMCRRRADLVIENLTLR